MANRSRLTALAAAAALVTGCSSLVGCSSSPSGSTATPPTAQPTAVAPNTSESAVSTSTASRTPQRTSTPGRIPAVTGGPTGPAHADRSAPAGSPPVRVRIPAIGVDSALQSLGLEKDGTLETPSQWQVAGWYADGVRPGDDGPAVIAGHVDSVSGPAVFFRLKSLERGDKVFVTRRDGSTVQFTVASTAEYPKRAFPTAAVYGPSPLPTLRLVTCTGDFDYAKRSYVDNLVVTAYARS